MFKGSAFFSSSIDYIRWFIMNGMSNNNVIPMLSYERYLTSRYLLCYTTNTNLSCYGRQKKSSYA